LYYNSSVVKKKDGQAFAIHCYKKGRLMALLGLLRKKTLSRSEKKYGRDKE